MSTGSDSSNPLKNPLYWLVKQDSRAASELGRALNLDYLTEEGKRNQENPGRALTKAAASAATWYLGGLMGAEAAGAGQGVLGAAAEGAKGLTAAEIAAQEAALASQGLMGGAAPAIEQGASMIPQGANALAPQGWGTNVMESALTDTGYTPSSLFQAFNNANAANNTSLSQNLAAYGRQGMANLKNGSMFNQALASMDDPKARLAMKMLEPQPQPQAPAAPPPRQGPIEPLPTPYGPGGNSMGMDPMRLTEAERQRLRRMGYRV